MRLRTIDTYDDALLDVAARSDTATFYHTRVWIESLAATFPRMSLRCIVADDGGETAGFLPFFYVRRGPFRSAWSLPFGTYGGPAALSADAAAALVDAYAGVMSSMGVIEAGWIDFGNSNPGTGWRVRKLETHLIDLSGGFESLWEQTIERQRKKRTRRAERLGVNVRRSRSLEDLRRYYQIYSARVGSWGAGIRYPEELFAKLFETGDDSVRLYVAECEDRIVGGHLNFYYKGVVTAWTGMTTPESTQTQAGTLLYIHCLREACEEGFRVYNLGGSLNKRSLIEYKESLGGAPYEYTQYYRRSLLGRAAAWIKQAGG
jgi:CelD/BcsL family acetyltransferase involved in cellulose biosynthesis